MQRDLDLARRILLAVETHADATLDEVPEFAGVDDDIVNHHVKLLREAGLLDALDASGSTWIALELTWNGHDFLDAARDDTLWNSARQQLGDKFASVPFEVLKALLVGLTKQALGLPPQR